MDGVIFSSTILLVLYGIAIGLCLFDIIKRASGYVFPILSAMIFTGTTVYAFILGAGYEEAGLITLVFLLLNLGACARKKGDK